ncbi:MAG: DUF1501 domain-containing protein [Planctomycetes bacterium]|nr:DUF1501 domain-containing protein [Planctomycetota bacterium]
MSGFVVQNDRCCGGFARRTFLQMGVLGIGGLALPQLLSGRARVADAGYNSPKSSVIFVDLAGGPSQFETYDPKPAAPPEYRGPLGVVSTKLPGVCFSELMIEQAKMADKLAVIRSIHHDSSDHGLSSHLVQTGHYLQQSQSVANEMPSVGSVVSHLREFDKIYMPSYVALHGPMLFGYGAYLGAAHNPFEVFDDPNRSGFAVKNLKLADELNVERLRDRRKLLGLLDRRCCLMDGTGKPQAIDKYTVEAFELITSDTARRAFDIESEPARSRERYGRTKTGQCLLLARRLVEAGVQFVTIRIGGWDNHGHIGRKIRNNVPSFDRAIAALIDDLYLRGMDRDVLVVAMGEFGRTPKLNDYAGRDHWSSLMSVVMAGGGLNVGQVVGRSNAKGELPVAAPYRPENVLAMVYRHLGIDPNMAFPDLSGRPRPLLERSQLITELI